MVRRRRLRGQSKVTVSPTDAMTPDGPRSEVPHDRIRAVQTCTRRLCKGPGPFWGCSSRRTSYAEQVTDDAAREKSCMSQKRPFLGQTKTVNYPQWLRHQGVSQKPYQKVCLRSPRLDGF